MNAQTLIEAALRKIGALARGFTLQGEDSAEALEELNRMLKSWRTQSLYIPYRTRETQALVVGDADYSIGSGADFNTVRPLSIESMFIRDSDDNDYPLESMEQSQYSRISSKSSQDRPSRFYYEPSMPNGMIYFDTQPGTAETLHIVSLKPLTGFAGLTTDHDLPEEYEDPIVYNLAVRMAPEYGKEPSQIVFALAAAGEENVKSHNAQFRVPRLAVDLRAGTGHYNIHLG